MAKKKTEELSKHTLNLRAGDLEELAILYPRHQPTVMVRKIISRFIDNTKAVAENRPETDIEIET